MAKKTLITLIIATFITACASTPEVVEKVETAAPAPEPVFTPAPAPQVVEAPAPAITSAPVPFDANLPVPGSKDDFAYSSGGESRVYFGYNQYRLSPEAIGALRRQADWLNSYQNVSAVIEGTTHKFVLLLKVMPTNAVRENIISR